MKISVPGRKERLGRGAGSCHTTAATYTYSFHHQSRILIFSSMYEEARKQNYNDVMCVLMHSSLILGSPC